MKKNDYKGLEAYLEEKEDLVLSSDDLLLADRYYTLHKETEVDEKTIMYEAYFGRGMICNPYALFLHLIQREEFSDYTHVWSLEKSPFNDSLRSLYSSDQRIVFVEPESDDYFYYQSRSKYLVNNVTWKWYFSPKKEQVIINTWHGVPLKKMGYEVFGERHRATNSVRNFLMSDYILSSSEYTTSLFRRAYKLDNLYDGCFIETGSPRNDLLVSSSMDDLKKLLEIAGIKINDKKKVALYAPTFRGDYSNPDINVEKIEEILHLIQNALGEKYQVFYKPHQIVYEHMRKNHLLRDNYLPAEIDTNMILSQTDLLISDYSSIFFDFLITDRPIIFYIPDFDEYSSDRGVYFSLEDLPGPVCHNKEELLDQLRHVREIGTQFDTTNYERLKNLLCHDDGGVCSRIVDAVWGSDRTNVITVEQVKPRILFQTDAILKNGISISALNLLSLIDTDKYDITFFSRAKDAEDAAAYVEQLPDDIRVLLRQKSSVGNIEDLAKSSYCLENAISFEDDPDIFPKYYYEMNYHRLFGYVRYDFIIDFSGFSPYFANLCRVNPDAVKLIWMHNVMKSEYGRITKGEKVFKKKLDLVFKTYEFFDYLVSCSKSTMLQNKKDLATPETIDKFRYVSNTMNCERVYAGKDNASILSVDNTDYLLIGDDGGRLSFVRKPDSESINFVTMGRLAEAKNHLNLLKAFNLFHKEVPDSALYIIGDGHLKGSLSTYINDHNLSEYVTITGNIENPFALMSRCSCFILPSYYEGQPMVLLEARTLGLPIIMSDFATAKDSSLEEGQLIIDTSVESILDGMRSFYRGEVPSMYQFDPDEYNREQLNRLYNILDNAEIHHG